MVMVVAVAAAACGQEDVSHPPAPTVAGYCVDSVNGDDLAGANDCTCEVSKNLSALKRGTPCRTIAAMTAKVPAGTPARVLLARDSSWREQIVASALPNGSSVLAYGSGARPILDAADVIPAAAWTKTAGRTNVYQATVNTGITPAGNRAGMGNRIWEDWTSGTAGRLAYVADVATCDATPGSWTGPTRPTGGNDVFYVHASDGSDPATSGKVYEWPARPYGVHGGQYPTDASKLAEIRGVETRRHGHHDGGILTATYAADFRVDPGGAGPVDPSHGLWCNGGVCEDGETSSVISYGDDLPGVTVRRVRVTCSAPVGAAAPMGIFFHTSVIGGHHWGKMVYEDIEGPLPGTTTCTFLLGGGTAQHIVVIRPRALNDNVNTLATYSHFTRLDVIGAQWVRHTAASDSWGVKVAAGATTNVRGGRFVTNRSFPSGVIYVDNASGAVTLTGNSFAFVGALGGQYRSAFNFSGAAAATSTRNFYSNAARPYDLQAAVTGLTAENNVYDTAASQYVFQSVYRDWAAWQAFGFDTTGSVRQATTMAGDITTGNVAPTAASAAWTVGAGADAYGDAHLAEWVAAIP